MEDTTVSQIMELKTKSLKELKAKYEEFFNGQKATSNKKIFLWRKLAYRIQEINYEGLSDDTQTRLNELIEHYDPVNNKALRPNKLTQEISQEHSARDQRLPIPGTVFTKMYKGQPLEIITLEEGFEFKGKTYKTLSAIAKEVTGTHWNGYLFFNL